MLTYANMAGIGYAGLTDGNQWELYEVFKAGRLEERRLLDVSIAKAPAHASALKLLLLWRPNLSSGQPVEAGTPLFDDPPASPAPPQPVLSGWIALSEYDPPAGHRCPAAIRFWDGSERPLARWPEVLSHVVEKLHAEGKITVDALPLGWGGKSTASIHTEPVHPYGAEFRAFKRIEGTPPLFVNVNLNALQVRRNTKRLLNHFGLNPADVHVREAGRGP